MRREQPPILDTELTDEDRTAAILRSNNYLAIYFPKIWFDQERMRLAKEQRRSENENNKR